MKTYLKTVNYTPWYKAWLEPCTISDAYHVYEMHSTEREYRGMIEAEILVEYLFPVEQHRLVEYRHDLRTASWL